MKVKELIERLEDVDQDKDVNIVILEDYLNDEGELYDREISSEALDVTEEEDRVTIDGYSH